MVIMYDQVSKGHFEEKIIQMIDKISIITSYDDGQKSEVSPNKICSEDLNSYYLYEINQ